MRHLYTCFRLCAALIGLFAGAFSAKASHILGGELFYTYVSGNTYKITMIMYGDCSGSAAAFQGLTTATPQIQVYNGATLVQTLVLTSQPGSGVNVSPVCPDEANNTTCNGGTLPGVKKFIYAANITLSTTSANWRFRSLGDLLNNTVTGRSNAITNALIPGGGSVMSLEATLNNATASNSSPTYTTIPTPFFCINKPQEYNQGAVDADGDSLSFNLVPGLDANFTPSQNVSYIAPFTATAPLGCAPGTFAFNNTNGQLSFFPNITQNALVVSRVSEYRNGVLIGTSMREMNFIVLNNCNNNPPDGTIGTMVNTTLVDPTTVKTCSFAGALSFSIAASDLDGDNITLSTQGTPAGAAISFSGNGTPNPVLNFSWNITGVAPGNYTFFLTFSDDGCPLASKQTVAYTVRILQKPSMSYALINPATCIRKGVFTVTPAGSDAPYSLNVTQGATSVLMRNNISGTITDSLSVGTYTFRITGSNGCYSDTVISLNHTSLIVPQLNWTQPLCPGGNTGVINAAATGNYPPFLYSVNALPYGTGTSFTGLTAGTYVLHVKDAAGCVKDTSFLIPDPPAMVLGAVVKKPVCSPVANGQISLSVVNGSAPWQFAINAGAFGASPTFGGLAAGTYVLQVKDGHNCTKDTTIVLTDSLHMQVQAVVSQVLCHGGATGSVALNAAGTTAPYVFALGAGAFGAANTFPNLAAGTYVLHVRDQNLCLKDTTITITQPQPLVLQVTPDQIDCYGEADGAIAATGTGGTPAYEFGLNAGALQASGQFNNLTAGTYTILIRDNNGCEDDTVITLTQPATAVQFGDFSITTPTCEGFTDGSVTLSAAGGVGPYAFSKNGGAFTAQAAFDGLQEGNYIFRVRDARGCLKDTLIALAGFPRIFIDEVAMTQPLCNGYADGTLQVTASGGLPPLLYRFDNGTWTGSPVFENKQAGNYVIYVKDEHQCVKDTTVTLGQPERLRIEKASSGNDCNGVDNGGTITLQVDGGTAPYVYFWQHDRRLKTDRATGLENGMYYITVTDAHDCSDSAMVEIMYNNCCTPFIPNAFSPNGDGNNDGYQVVYKGDMELKEMYVYNRYGQRIFSSADVNKSWDGTYNGQPVDAGTYFYYIRILCGNVLKKELIFRGDVTLIR